MKRHASWIILAIAAIFILSMAIEGIVSIFVKNPYKYVGVIDNRKITYSEYKDLLSNTYASHFQENPETEIDDKLAQELNDKTWNNLLQVTLFSQEVKKRRIKVREKDVIARLKDPAEDIKSIEQFQTNGVFDQSKYEKMLYDNPEFATFMESRVRGMLPFELLYEDVKSEVFFSYADLEEEYIKENTKVDADIIHFDPKLAVNVEATDEDMADYYERHKEDYKKGPARKYKFVRIALEPSEADKAAAKTKIDSLYKLIMEGADFAETARDFSDDPSASNGGDLGYFNEGRMVQEFNDVAFAMKIGEISEPLKTEYGWHIIKCTGRKTGEDGMPQVQASHILVKFTPSEDTKRNQEILANDLYDRARKIGLEQAAEELAYQMLETKDFYKDSQYIPILGKDEGQVAFAFSNRVGKLHEPYKLGDNYIVAQISYKVGDHYQEMAEVESRVKREVLQEKKLAVVTEMAENFLAENTPENYLKAAAAKDIAVVNGKDITADSSIPGIRRDLILNEAIMAMNAGDISGLIKGEFAAYIAIVIQRKEADMDVFEKDKVILYQTKLESKRNERLNAWYKELIDNSNIIDNRSLFFN